MGTIYRHNATGDIYEDATYCAGQCCGLDGKTQYVVLKPPLRVKARHGDFVKLDLGEHALMRDGFIFTLVVTAEELAEHFTKDRGLWGLQNTDIDELVKAYEDEEDGHKFTDENVMITAAHGLRMVANMEDGFGRACLYTLSNFVLKHHKEAKS